jgi:pimeloyl-ACP methyl ester carboxylesterase
VDQSPLQNYTSDGSWGLEHGNKSCNSAAALAHIQATLSYRPEDIYNGTINSCLAYLSHPLPTDNVSHSTMREDVDFFLKIALKGNGPWFGRLMADHTSLDWRASIRNTFGGHNSSKTRVLVVASSRSGCFPPAGPLHVVDLVNSESASSPEPIAQGLVIDWGGHWCYYEEPEKFNALALEFLALPAPLDARA